MRRGRKSLREQLTESHRASSFYAAMAGKAPPPAPVIAAPRRTRKRSAGGKPLERDILRAVLEALRHHPRVAFAWRMQSGLFQDGDRYIRVGSVGLPDILCMLKGTAQLVAIEVKRPGGYATGEQLQTLAEIRDYGGRAGVARSVEDAIAIIEGKNT